MATTTNMDSYLNKITDAMHSPNFNQMDFVQLIINVLSDFVKDPNFQQYSTASTSSTHESPAVSTTATHSEIPAVAHNEAPAATDVVHTQATATGGQGGDTHSTTHSHTHSHTHSQGLHNQNYSDIVTPVTPTVEHVITTNGTQPHSTSTPASDTLTNDASHTSAAAESSPASDAEVGSASHPTSTATTAPHGTSASASTHTTASTDTADATPASDVYGDGTSADVPPVHVDNSSIVAGPGGLELLDTSATSTPANDTHTSNTDNSGGPSFSVDHAQGTLVNMSGVPVQGITARITTPDDVNTQDAIDPNFYQTAAENGADIVRLDVVASAEGRTVDEQIPIVQQAVAAAESAGLGVQLMFSQNVLTFDRQETVDAWSKLAPMYADDKAVTFEGPNEPAWTDGYDSNLLDGLADVYHVMRDAAPDKPIAVLGFPMMDNAGVALDAIHGLEDRGVSFNDQTTVAWHNYWGPGVDVASELRNDGYAVQMTEITDTSPGNGETVSVISDLNKAGIAGFTLDGGFGDINKFVDSTVPGLKDNGVDWTADGTVSPSANIAHAATTTQGNSTLSHVNSNTDTGSTSDTTGTQAHATATAGNQTQQADGEDVNLSVSNYDNDGEANVSSATTASRDTPGTTNLHVTATDTSDTSTATHTAASSQQDSSNASSGNTTNHPTIVASNDHTAAGNATNTSADQADDQWAAWDLGDSTSTEAGTGGTTSTATTPTASTTAFTRSPFASPAHDQITQQHPGDPALVTSYSPDMPTGHLDTANSVHETFDNGAGMMSNTWGDVQAGNGYIDVTSPASDHAPAGAMVAPTGADAGMGYGHYSFTLSTNTANVGPYAALWPSTDNWPGPEIDVFELGPNGDSPFDTVHFNDNGNDGFNWAQMPSGIDPTQPHTYAVDWQDGSMTFSVDGQNTRTVTENIPKDFANGGENLSPGVGVLTHNFDPGLNPVDNTLTLYDFTYTPHTDAAFA